MSELDTEVKGDDKYAVFKKKPDFFETLELKQVLKVLGLCAFFIFCFLIFFYLTFPTDKLRDFIVREVSFPRRGERRVVGQYDLQIGELSPSWFTGVNLYNVKLRQRGGKLDPALMEVTIPEMSVRVSLLKLLTGNRAGTFELEVGGGIAEGYFETDDDHMKIDMTLDEVQLRRIGLIRVYTKGMPIVGRVSGTIDLNVAADKEQTQGRIELHATKARVADGKTPVKIPRLGEMTFDQLELGNVDIELDVERGQGVFKKFAAKSKEIDAKIKGTVNMKWPIRQSAPNLLAKIKILDAYKKKSPKAEAIFMLVDGNPMAKRLMTKDGAFQMRLIGSIGSLSYRPAPREDFDKAK